MQVPFVSAFPRIRQYARRTLVGQFPSEDARWKRLQDYYLNCIADCDQHVDRILQELDDLGLAENTIVVMTSDHGELAGAHSMHGKGATAYREQLHVPLWIRHPGNAVAARAHILTINWRAVPWWANFQTKIPAGNGCRTIT